MKEKKVDVEEMELRKDKDVTAAKKMGAEGGPPIQGDNVAPDSTTEKKTDSDEKA